MSPPLYKIESIPGKGRGLVASSEIAMRTRILSEHPLFTLASAVDSLECNVVAKVKTLSKEQQRYYLSLYNKNPEMGIFSGIFRTNALPCGVGSITGAIYPTICLMNHACDPNAHHSWNSATGSETIHALCDIKAGEEITISYNRDEPASVRRANLKSSFGFDCTCGLCSLPPAEIQHSDARRLRIEELDEEIGNSASVMNTPVCFFLRIIQGLLTATLKPTAN
jgi:hypothetical protein